MSGKHPNEIKAIARQLMIDGIPRRSHWYRGLRTRYGDVVTEQIFGELDAIEVAIKAEIATLNPAAVKKEERRD